MWTRLIKSKKQKPFWTKLVKAEEKKQHWTILLKEKPSKRKPMVWVLKEGEILE